MVLQELADKIKNWNKEDVSELREVIKEYSDLNTDKIPLVDFSDLPTMPFPDDYDTTDVWALDKKGNILTSNMTSVEQGKGLHK